MRHMENYVNACRCKTEEDVAEALMKLVGVCGECMHAFAGHANTVERLLAITNHINKTMVNKTWKRKTGE